MNTTLTPLTFDGEPVDTGILELVYYLRSAGFETIASCQGKSPSQRGHAFNMPLVRIDLHRDNDACVQEKIVGVCHYMSHKYHGFGIHINTSYNEHGQLLRVLLDVMFVKSVKEEFDIAKYRKPDPDPDGSKAKLHAEIVEMFKKK